MKIGKLREEKRKVTFRMGENEAEIDFVLIKKEHRRFFRSVEAIFGQVQHAVVMAGIDKRKIRKVERKTCSERRKITLLKDVKIRKRNNEKVTKLVDVGAPSLWGHHQHGVIDAGDELCGKKQGRRSKGDTWCWNEELKEAV